MGAPLFKEFRRAYGFDEVAIVPGEVTINPDLASTDFSVGDRVFGIPIIAAAMDAIVSPSFAGLMHQNGGLGVMNLEGIYSRYEDPYSALEEVVAARHEECTELLQQIYSEPVKEELISKSVRQIKETGAVCCVSHKLPRTPRSYPR